MLSASIYRSGIPLDREALMAWLAAGLLAASIGRRPLWTVVVDWVPFALILIVYDFARGAATSVGLPTWWHPQLEFDRFLFGGTEPTVWLQEHFRQPTVRWWDVVATLTYSSFFLLPYVVAGIFWLRSRREFAQWVTRYVSLVFLGVVGFILVPAAPPWAAARCQSAEVANHPSYPSCLNFNPQFVPHDGLLGNAAGNGVSLLQRRFLGISDPHDYVQRISTRGWAPLHVKFAQALLDKGQGTVDLVAAVPSLHAAVTMLFAIFLWRRSPWWARILLVVYPLLMAVSLVYTAEHYVFDILLGWLLALAVHVAVGRVGRWRTGSENLVRLDPPKPTASRMENSQWPPTETTPSSTSASDEDSSSHPARSMAEPAPPGTTGPSG